MRASPQPNDAGDDGLGWRFWCLVPATGVAAGLAAGLLMLLLHAVQHLAWGEGEAGFLRAVEAASPVQRVGVLALGGLVAGLGRLAIRREGGHAGGFAAAIWFRAGRLPFWPTLSQAVLSILVVGLGASLGREAAPKQAGAAFGSFFASRVGLSASHRRLLAAFGAGAGIAAVYDVPLGGALFALEVLLGSVSLPLIAPAVLAAGLGTAVSWLMLPDKPTYAVPPYGTTAGLVAFALLFGPVAGVLSALYVRLIARADRTKPSGRGIVLAPLVVFAALGMASLVVPQLLGNGKDVVQLAFTGEAVPLALLLVVLLKPLATAACLGSGAPGGLFTPTIAFGAALGGLAGAGWALVWPSAPAGAFALVGAAAVLAATTKGPASAVVLMLELTRTLDAMIVPVLLGVGGAMLAARFLEPRSIYACRIHDGMRRAEEAGAPAISAAARYPDLLRALALGGAVPRAMGEHGEDVGKVSAERALHPHRDDGPLATAAAGDFVAGEMRG